MSRFVLILVFGCVLGLPENLVAQANQVQLSARRDRVQRTLLVADRESGNAGSVLELVPEQREKLQRLRTEYDAFLDEVHPLIKKSMSAGSTAENLKVHDFMEERMTKLENKLYDEILLPHQVDALRGQVFLSSVAEYEGNIVEVITSTYADEFGLDNDQVKRLWELKDDVNKRVAEAKAKFKKEMEDIGKSADKDMRAVFSNGQLEKFEGFSKLKSR